jgi:amino-acid N-acetyltransferase
MIRKARMEDVARIQKMLELSARKGELLPRPLAELYDSIRDFTVFTSDTGQLVGCCALHPAWDDLGEIRSLIVREEARRQSIGRTLVAHCLQEADALGIRSVFVLTFNSAYFQSLGFAPIPKSKLPHKIWTDCIRCIHFPDCQEEALWIELEKSTQH